MSLPDPPQVFVDYGFVTAVASVFNDWGSVSDVASVFVDWDAVIGPGKITSSAQVTKPIDKMWAFLGREERRRDGRG